MPKKTKQRRARQPGDDRSALHIPSFQPGCTVKKNFRWSLLAGGVYTIGIKAIGDIWCVGDSGGVLLYQVFNFLRVRRVQVWAPALATGLPSSCSVEFGTGSISQPDRSRVISDTVLGTSGFAYVSARPSKEATTGFWQSTVTSTATVFVLNVPVGAIVELQVEGTIRDLYGPTAATTASVGTLAGTFYQRGLDGLGPATGQFQPISAVWG